MPAFANVLDQAIDDLISQLAVSHLTAAKTQGRLHLVAVVEKPDGLIFLGLVVMLVDGDRELDFLDGDDLLLFARSPFALIFFVQDICRNPECGKPAARRWERSLPGRGRVRGQFSELQRVEERRAVLHFRQ